MSGSADGVLVYVYGVFRVPSAEAVAALTALGDEAVRLVTATGLAAVVRDVDADRLPAAGAAAERGDLARLAETARAHHRVVDAVGRVTPVAPLALGTVYVDDARVHTVLLERQAAFAAVLDRVAGRSEWGVKAWVRAGSRAGDDDAAGPARSGAEYLRRRRAVLRERDEGVDDAVRAADDVHERARGLAVDARRHRLQDAALSGRGERMVLNGAYLVDDAEPLRGLVADLAEHPRLAVELTGPWVPYSFAEATP